MNVVMISGHACIRVHKMAIPLVQRGWKVHLISKKVPPGMLHYYYTFGLAFGLSQYLDSIDVYAPTTDIFHAHNEPSWFVTAVKERCDAPVILDVHDSHLARMTPEEEEALIDEKEGKKAYRVITEERTNFQLADGLIFPGQAFAEKIVSEYKLTQPWIVLPSYVPREFYQYNGLGWQGGLVYEGRVDLPEENTGQAHGFRYDDYLELAKECQRIGMDLHLYSNRADEKFLQVYDPLAICHGPKEYHKLLFNLQRHDWGLVGNLEPTPEWDVAMPNKLFEYLAAGTPVVAINAPECGAFLRQHGMGIEVSSIEELAARWSEHTEIRKTVLKKRQQFAMENHIAQLENFYREVLDARHEPSRRHSEKIRERTGHGFY